MMKSFLVLFFKKEHSSFLAHVPHRFDTTRRRQYEAKH